MSESKDLI